MISVASGAARRPDFEVGRAGVGLGREPSNPEAGLGDPKRGRS
jgi:hypothetical protein